ASAERPPRPGSTPRRRERGCGPRRSSPGSKEERVAHNAPSPAPTPGAEQKPFIPANQDIAEFSLKAVIFGSLFGILFGASTVYLALKAGLTVSASIPIAVLSISVLKLFGKSTILENNIVQTIGSA